MAYEITLIDGSQTWTSPTPDTPLSEQVIELSSEVTTLDLNIYVDLLNTKKIWTVRWGYMSTTEYNILLGFYNRQSSNLEFPELTIPDLGVTGIITRMTISDKNIVDESGLIENVEITLRETVQTTNNYFVS